MIKTIGENQEEAQKLLSEVLNKVQEGTESISGGFRKLWDFLHKKSLELDDVVTQINQVAPLEKRWEIRAAITDYGDFKSESTAMKAYNFFYRDESLIVGMMTTINGKPAFKILCSPLRIRGLTEDVKTKSIGTLISIQDRFGNWRDVVLSQAELFGDGDKWVKKLTDAGLKILGKLPDLKRLIHCVDSQKKIKTVDQIGWLEGENSPTFMFPDRKANGSNRMFSGDMASYHMEGKGSLEDWKKEIAVHGEENSRLGLAICISLAGPLLRPLGIESGGFNVMGPSSSGKTTALQVGASAWGKGVETKEGYIKSWRSTDNAMEGVAYRHNDVGLFIDEIGQADKTLGATIYMIANGGGKDRMKASTEARAPVSWRTIFMSTGEATIADKIESEGKKSTGGQAVRVVDLYADAGVGFGVFDVVPTGMTGSSFSTLLKKGAITNYGTAGPAFVKHIEGHYTYIHDTGRDVVELLAASFAPSSSDGQVHRVATRFALIAYAGELAIACGILPWKGLSAAKMAQRCFNDWLKMRGTSKALEPKKGVEAVLKFIMAHGNSRFQSSDEDNLVINRVGFKKKTRVYLHAFIQDDEWKVSEISEWVGQIRPMMRPIEVTQYWIDNQCWSEVCGGNSPVQTARQLRSEGLLKTREGRSLTCTKKFSGLNDKNYYVIELREGDTAAEWAEALRFAPTETRRQREAEAEPDMSPDMVAYREWCEIKSSSPSAREH